MGLFVMYLASSGAMTSGPGFQVAFGKRLASAFKWVETVTAPVPEAILGLVVLALAAVFVYATLRNRPRNGQPNFAPEDDPELDDPEFEVVSSSREDTTEESPTRK
jgi:cytochrome c-type biogenesis protein